MLYLRSKSSQCYLSGTKGHTIFQPQDPCKTFHDHLGPLGEHPPDILLTAVSYPRSLSYILGFMTLVEPVKLIMKEVLHDVTKGRVILGFKYFIISLF